MIVAGLAHFTNTAVYVALMPPWMPWHHFLVYVSGVLEAGLGALLLWPKTSRWAAWGLIACFLAIFPANVHHAVSGGLDDPALPAFFANQVIAWLRLPFQIVFIAWALWFAADRPPPLPEDR
jgi:uncharacterized membrane protein